LATMPNLRQARTGRTGRQMPGCVLILPVVRVECLTSSLDSSGSMLMAFAQILLGVAIAPEFSEQKSKAVDACYGQTLSGVLLTDSRSLLLFSAFRTRNALTKVRYVPDFVGRLVVFIGDWPMYFVPSATLAKDAITKANHANQLLRISRQPFIVQITRADLALVLAANWASGQSGWDNPDMLHRLRILNFTGPRP